jgi:hypothetical protein
VIRALLWGLLAAIVLVLQVLAWPRTPVEQAPAASGTGCVSALVESEPSAPEEEPEDVRQLFQSQGYEYLNAAVPAGSGSADTPIAAAGEPEAPSPPVQRPEKGCP